ncbi:MAG: hypothetical protein ACRYG7_11605 [Janthinobacterium lividum]
MPCSKARNGNFNDANRIALLQICVRLLRQAITDLGLAVGQTRRVSHCQVDRV